MKLIISSLFFFIAFFSIAQTNTVGLIHQEEGVAEGYVFFSPDRNNKSYLINNCGEVINDWTFSQEPGRSAYILENGNVLYAGETNLEIRDWNSNLVWSLDVNTTLGFNQHHDIEPLPNGNILLIVNDNYDSTTMFAQGIRPSFGSTEFRLDKIVEIQPTGTNGANIVWEWKFFDHLIQDVDSTKPNYGVVNDHPELLDMNYIGPNESNFVHVNAIDYNSELDQILFSARNMNEIYIIDHSTSTAEAASHSGGNSDKGGDFLWRWGNPKAYHSSFSDLDRKLGGQHNCTWVLEGTQQGKISVFSNAKVTDNTKSEVLIINPVYENNNYTMTGNLFLPFESDWSWSGELNGETMKAAIKSGVQILPNHNALTIESTKGRISEIDSAGNLVWLYEIPDGLSLINQFDTPVNNGAFRATRYPLDYVGFFGKDLTTKGIIENQNQLSESCGLVFNTIKEEENKNINIYPNPVRDNLTIEVAADIIHYQVYNAVGLLVKEGITKQIDCSALQQGIYTIQIFDSKNISTLRFIKS